MFENNWIILAVPKDLSQLSDRLLNNVQEWDHYNDSAQLSVGISLLLVLRGDVFEREVNRGQRLAAASGNGEGEHTARLLGCGVTCFQNFGADFQHGG